MLPKKIFQALWAEKKVCTVQKVEKLLVVTKNDMYTTHQKSSHEIDKKLFILPFRQDRLDTVNVWRTFMPT